MGDDSLTREMIRRLVDAEARLESLEALETPAMGRRNAVVYRNSRQQWSVGTWTPLSWNIEVEDSDDLWDAGSPARFTIRHEGVYVVSAGMRWSGGVATTVDRWMAVRVNGTVILHQTYYRTANAGWVHQFIAAVTPRLEVDDYVEVLAKHDRGTNFGPDAASATDYSPNGALIVQVA